MNVVLLVKHSLKDPGDQLTVDLALAAFPRTGDLVRFSGEDPHGGLYSVQAIEWDGVSTKGTFELTKARLILMLHKNEPAYCLALSPSPPPVVRAGETVSFGNEDPHMGMHGVAYLWHAKTTAFNKAWLSKEGGLHLVPHGLLPPVA